MSNVRRRCAVLALITLIAAGCGGGDDDSAPTTPTDTEAPSAPATDDTPDTTQAESESEGDEPAHDSALTPDMCAALGEDEPPANLADVVPSDFANAAQLLIDLVASFEIDGPMSPDVIDRFTSPTIGEELTSFADAAERDCGASEAL